MATQKVTIECDCCHSRMQLHRHRTHFGEVVRLYECGTCGNARELGVRVSSRRDGRS